MVIELSMTSSDVQIFVLMWSQVVQFPQLLYTFFNVSKFHLVVNKNHIQLYFNHNTEI
jgi:hypothetical protein